MQNKTIAATRSTGNGTKVYIHSNCTCARINGKAIPASEVDSIETAQKWAADFRYPAVMCKNSQPLETAPVAEEPQAAGAPEFELVVDNRDQYGRQRREAVAKLVAALGAELAFSGIKNKHRTGNDAFAIQVTKAPAAAQSLVESLLAELDAGLDKVVAQAKADGAARGWDSNTRQKHYKNTARAFILTKGAQAAAKLA